MPRKYLAMPNDVFALSSIATIYSMINPIEKKLVAAGYKGPLLADFDNDIYKELGVEDKEATRKLQEQSNEEWEAENKEGEAPKVAPAYKKTADHFIAKGDTFQSEGIGSVIINNNSFTNSDEFTEESDKEFHKYLAKFDKYLDLLISNTPEEEFKEEFTQLRFQKANIRAVKTFGSGQVFSNELGFAWSMEMFDSDLPCIKEPGVPGSGVSRELWKQTYKNYPYGDLLEASTDILNTACDYEENKEKNTYIGQIKYRENYRNAIQGYLDAARSLANDPETAERTIKQIRKEEVIKMLKEFDGPDKDIDYNEIIKRVEEQNKKGQEPNPEDSAIAKKINDIVNKEYKPGDYSEYNTRYAFELKGMGYAPSERDFTGNRGIQLMIPEIEAQLNAIDMGWPMDELVNIQRLTVFLRNNIRPNGKQFSDEQKKTIEKARNFYDTRIKDKPYPDTEEERKKFYGEFLKVGMDLKTISTQEIQDVNEDTFVLEWTAFTDKLQECVDKPLTFAEKLALDNALNKDEDLTINADSVRELKDGIGKDRFGHINSTEYKELKNAFGKFETAFAKEQDGFVVTEQKDISPDNLKILEGLRASAEKYLIGKDTEKKLPEERSEMGKARYESAQKAYRIADKLLKQHEEKLEKEANAKKQAEREKGRKEMKEAFFDANSEEGKKSINFDRLRAGGDEAYSKLKEEEAEAAKKEPVTDEEKYDKFINECRLKKDDPVSYGDEGLNKEMQQKRVDDLGNMLAALEYKASGKPYNEAEIFSRGAELKDVYSLNALKLANEKVNGPEKLKNALTFGFRAEALKSQLEQGMYEVGKKKYKNTNEAQSKYQKDITELLERKQPEQLSEKSQKIINALNEIKNINTDDKNLAAMNAYKMGKANKHLMETIRENLLDTRKMDMNAYDSKLALDSLAVLTTYTNCNAATKMLLEKVNARNKNMDGSKLNINTATFNKNYGVKHSKELAQAMSPRPNVPVNNVANPQMAAQGNQQNAERKNSRNLH